MAGIESLFTDDELTAIAVVCRVNSVGINEMMANGLMDLLGDAPLYATHPGWTAPATPGPQLSTAMILRMQLAMLLGVPSDSTHEEFSAAIAALGTGLGAQYLHADLASKLGRLVHLESE